MEKVCVYLLLALCLGLFRSSLRGAKGGCGFARQILWSINKQRVFEAAQCERKAYYSPGVIGLYYYGDSIVGYLWSSTSRYAPSKESTWFLCDPSEECVLQGGLHLV